MTRRLHRALNTAARSERARVIDIGASCAAPVSRAPTEGALPATARLGVGRTFLRTG